MNTPLWTAAIVLGLSFLSPGAAVSEKAFSGAAAFSATRHAVGFGERPSGSPAIAHLRDWIVTQVESSGGQVSLDPFQGQTPNGPVSMANIVVRFPGTSGKAVVITGHYDTKSIAMVHFVGANDAGSSTGFLVELARAISKVKHADDMILVFFDGEEAVGEWTATDSLYGSRHLTSEWGADGSLARIKALINVDMIGDKDLDILNDGNSSQSLRDSMWSAAQRTGNAQYFLHQPAGIEDDHQPFAHAGINVLDMIDFTYGPDQSYWHTAADTMDKLSAHSFQVVGDVVLAMISDLEQQKTSGAISLTRSEQLTPDASAGSPEWALSCLSQWARCTSGR